MSGLRSCFQLWSRIQKWAEQRQTNQKINLQLASDKAEYLKTHTVLLLGLERAGKSTIVKQIRQFHLNGFDEKEKKHILLNIKKNICDAMMAIAKAMQTLQPPILATEENISNLEYILNISPKFEDDEEFDSTFFDIIESLWSDPGVQKCYDRSDEYQLIDCAKYFLDQISTIRQEDYIPSFQDILRCQEPTKKTVEIKCEIDTLRLHVVDVGGQKGSWKKWMQCFNDILCIMFVVASNGYDVVEASEEGRNELKKSIEVFQNTWNNQWLSTTSAILLLNKHDLLKEKILSGKSKLEVFFPEFKYYFLPNDADPADQEDPRVTRAKYFIRDEFLRISTTGDNRHYCYPHYTCALDTEITRRVFNDCQDIIQRMHLRQYKLL